MSELAIRKKADPGAIGIRFRGLRWRAAARSGIAFGGGMLGIVGSVMAGNMVSPCAAREQEQTD